MGSWIRGNNMPQSVDSGSQSCSTQSVHVGMRLTQSRQFPSVFVWAAVFANLRTYEGFPKGVLVRGGISIVRALGALVAIVDSASNLCHNV